MQLYMGTKLGSKHAHLGYGAGSEESKEDLNFIPQTDSWHTDSLQISRKQKQ